MAGTSWRVVGRSQIKPHSVTMVTENGRDIAHSEYSEPEFNSSSVSHDYIAVPLSTVVAKAQFAIIFSIAFTGTILINIYSFGSI